MTANPFRIWSVERRFSHAQRLARRRDYDGAITAFDEALSLNDHHGRIHLQKGLAQSAKGQHVRAIASLKKAIELEPRNSVFRFYQSLILYDAGQFAEAGLAVESGRELDPRNGFAKGLQGLLLLKEDYRAEACDLLLERGVLPLNHLCEARLLAACADSLREHPAHSSLEHAVEDLRGESNGSEVPWGFALDAEIRLFCHVPELDADWEAGDPQTHGDSRDREPPAREASDSCAEPVPYSPLPQSDVQFYALALSALPDMQTQRMDLASLYFNALYEDSPLAAPTKKRRRGRRPISRPSGPMLTLQGIVFRAIHRPRDAERSLCQSIAEAPDLAAPHFVLGLIAGERDDPDAAVRHYEDFASRSHGHALEQLLRSLRRAVEHDSGDRARGKNG
jgi:tetratricopeptide (TPR) repeat protein